MDSDVERILKQARKSISLYCINECKAYCCRKGNLLLKKSEAKLITKRLLNKAELEGKISKNKDGLYTLFFKDNNHICPSLIDNMCVIHKNRGRPKTCKEFPIYKKNDLIMFSSQCPAVIDNLLFSYIKKLFAKGYISTNMTNVFRKNGILENKSKKNNNQRVFCQQANKAVEKNFLKINS